MHGTGGGAGGKMPGIPSRHPEAQIASSDKTVQIAVQTDDLLFTQFARHSDNALWMADAVTGRFQYLNPAAVRLWAVAAGGLDQWHDRVHPHDCDRVAQQRARVATGESQSLSYRLCDGAVVRQFRETSFPIPGDGISGPRVAGIAEDISADMPTYLVADSQQDGLTAEALRATGQRYRSFSPEEFLRVADSLVGGCAIVDLNGLMDDPTNYLHALKARASVHALILIGMPDATQAAIIGAMKAGAIDYLLHPPSAESVGGAIAAVQVGRPPLSEARIAQPVETADRLARLPRREHEVLAGLMDGGTNKSIGRTLGISPRTVEAHRAHLMDRLNVRTLTDLIRVAIAAGFQPTERAITADA